MPKISVFPVPRFIDLTFLSLQVLSKNILCFENPTSKTAKGQVAIFALYRKMVPENQHQRGDFLKKEFSASGLYLLLPGCGRFPPPNVPASPVCCVRRGETVPCGSSVSV